MIGDYRYELAGMVSYGRSRAVGGIRPDSPAVSEQGSLVKTGRAHDYSGGLWNHLTYWTKSGKASSCGCPIRQSRPHIV